MKSSTVCFTGHRAVPVEQEKMIRQCLRETIISLISAGYDRFESGGALGFDTMAAQAVLELREQYPDIQLILILPYHQQAVSWSRDERAVYERIKKSANDVIYVSAEYTKGCLHKRNRCLADHSSVCICYLTGPTGGTAYTVRYAQRMRLRVINIAELLRSSHKQGPPLAFQNK